MATLPVISNKDILLSSFLSADGEGV